MRNALIEAVLVALVGAVVAFVTNALSPRGLNLRVNYFPGSTATEAPVVRSTNQVSSASPAAPVAPAPAPIDSVAQKVEREGLHLIGSQEAIRLFNEPGYLQESIVFVDARKDEDYKAGHVPGAYPFDRFHFENYLPTIFPACQQAQQVVVYCHGGDCEDSIFAAIMLRDVGIPKEKLFVYGGGWSEWETNRVPIELGERKSGNLKPATK